MKAIQITFCLTCELTLGRCADTIARNEMDFDDDDLDAELKSKIKVMNLLEWLVT